MISDYKPSMLKVIEVEYAIWSIMILYNTGFLSGGQGGAFAPSLKFILLPLGETENSCIIYSIQAFKIYSFGTLIDTCSGGSRGGFGG